MSEYTATTGLSSILKNYSSAERDKIKLSTINKVRFAVPKEKGLLYVVNEVVENGSYQQYQFFLDFISCKEITDEYFLRLLEDGRKVIHLLKPETFPKLIEAIVALNWNNRNQKCVEYFKEFVVDILVAHNSYSKVILNSLINLWVPEEHDKHNWENGNPNKVTADKLNEVHLLIERLLIVMPMLHRVLTNSIEFRFPYYKKPPHVVAGYIYNCFEMLRYCPTFAPFIQELIIKNLLKIDVNAPRNEIEDSEDQINCDEIADEATFQMELEEKTEIDIKTEMVHSVAEVLDVCLAKLFEYSKEIFELKKDQITRKEIKVSFDNYFKNLLDIFENLVLTSHNTHHVQFIMFYCCSFKPVLAETFLSFLWEKITNPNISAPIRQASVGYLVSFLSRANFLSLSIVRNYLSKMCEWAHEYINRCDNIRCNISIKGNSVFFAICQGIFYVIAFKSKELTKDKKGLLFLQSLQLSTIVTSSFNPLRVCLPTIATAFAGVTRTYQLAYCHAILERNARRKLATIYANEIISPEECLDTFFPFDPYLLKKSGKSIAPIYLQYQASDIEESEGEFIEKSRKAQGRKRGDSEMDNDDKDDFLTMDKKFKQDFLSKNFEKELCFNYGLSPGFN